MNPAAPTPPAPSTTASQDEARRELVEVLRQVEDSLRGVLPCDAVVVSNSSRVRLALRWRASMGTLDVNGRGLGEAPVVHLQFAAHELPSLLVAGRCATEREIERTREATARAREVLRVLTGAGNAR